MLDPPLVILDSALIIVYAREHLLVGIVTVVLELTYNLIQSVNSSLKNGKRLAELAYPSGNTPRKPKQGNDPESDFPVHIKVRSSRRKDRRPFLPRFRCIFRYRIRQGGT